MHTLSMKKLLIFCSLAILSISNTGCQKNTENETKQNLTNTPESTVLPSPSQGSSPVIEITKTATIESIQATKTATVLPSSTPILCATPTQITYHDATATADNKKDALLQFTWYCDHNRYNILNIEYLQSLAFEPDMSVEAQELLKSPLLVKPVCHFDKNNQPEAIVLHYTGSLANHEGSLMHFREPTSGTSAHYLVERDGTIIQLLPESYVANHVSCYGRPAVNCLPGAPLIYDEEWNYTRPATRSIGIEIVNAGPLVFPDSSPDVLTDKYETPYEGEIYIFEEFDIFGRYKYEFWEPYPDVQLEALRILINDIQARWGFNLVLGHNDLQTNIDPGPALKDFIDSFK